MTVERRTVVAEVETRAEGSKQIIAGYAAVFNARSQNLGGFVEEVKPGAFNKTLQEQDVRAYFNHDKNLILGRKDAGTLRLSVDDHGLHYEIDASDATYARDLLIAIERGDVSHSSFAFRTAQGPNAESWSMTDDGFTLRSLNEVWLYDVSPVVTPAYDSTSVSFDKRSVERLCEARGIDPTSLADTAADEAVRAILTGSELPTVGDSTDTDEERQEASHAPLSVYQRKLELLSHS